METPPPRIFISYSRSDGRAFAEAFERRLAGEGIHAWRDIRDMGGGEVRPQPRGSDPAGVRALGFGGG